MIGFRLLSYSIPLVFLICFPICGQWTVKLKPETIREFRQYANSVEKNLQIRWRGRKSFLSIDDDPQTSEKVLSGDLIIHPGASENPAPVSGGLVHDWVGAAFIPNASMKKVLEILQDFDKHAQIYPAVVRSRLIRRNGNDLTGMWRLERKDPMLTVVLDVEQEAHYEEIGKGKWICRAYAERISEIENPGSRKEKELPPDEGNGFLWRLYAYWSLEAVNNGVLAECRTLSLSRDIPQIIAFLIKPFVQKLPHDSLASTLESTRAAAAK